MMRKFGLAAALAGFLSFAWYVAPAAAQVSFDEGCATPATAKRLLERRYDEAVVARAVTGSGNLLEVYASPGGATWTLVVTVPGANLACIVGAGEAWRPVPPAESGRGEQG